ncbi:MAG: Beta-barrel assembly-enhancing protease [Alphaproteobacteria bacterium MarineAlpha3_Bin5]|nr:peptidase M48 [Magnetovibrio sp.]PPR78863.1 MAG: Beta-barrel assembly-enhancing protease [Alphaproteobacteria bacterium MarineAlpha3_Bin5]
MFAYIFHLQSSLGSLFLSAVLTVILTACSTNPETGKSSFTGFMSPAQEAKIGAQEHPKLLGYFGGRYPEEYLAKYINRIGSRLLAASGNSGMKFQFTILNDPKVNAFALPGGYIYVTRGLIALAEDEAELAGVIAHEIAHVLARHTAERYSQGVAANIGLATLGAVAPAIGIPVRVGHLVSFGAEAALRAYSRSQELEADLLAVRYMNSLGYDPAALINFFVKLEREKRLQSKKTHGSGNTSIYQSILSTHPRTKDRIRQAVDLNRKTVTGKLKRRRENFLSFVDGMLFGSGRRDGFLKGQTFYHPHLGFSFDIPIGFQVENLEKAVVASNSPNTTITFDLEVPPKTDRHIDLVNYLRKRNEKSFVFSSIETIKVNGMEAVVGSGSISFGFGKSKHVKRVIIRGNNFTLFRFTLITSRQLLIQVDSKFRQIVYSFRLLSPREAAQIKPHRIRVVRVTTNDSIASLASRMPFGPFNEHWFKVLNTNVVDDGLAVGEKVKLVVD